MAKSMVAESCQYLTFKLGEELFALDISNVREVLDYTTITRVPRMPDYMLGVINLRGNVVPVVDMRMKFALPQGDKTVNTCIVIVEVEVEGENLVLGALVDSVQEVFDLDSDHVEPPPKLGTRLNTDFIRGMGKRDEQFVIILEINKIFSIDEVTQVVKATE